MPICIDCGKEAESNHWKTKRCNSCRVLFSKKWRTDFLERTRDKRNARNREKYALNPEPRKNASKKARKNRYSERSQKIKEWKTKRPEKIREYSRRSYKKQKEMISDSYLKHELGFPVDEAPHEIIELKRLQLKLRRLCNEKC